MTDYFASLFQSRFLDMLLDSSPSSFDKDSLSMINGKDGRLIKRVWRENDFWSGQFPADKINSSVARQAFQQGTSDSGVQFSRLSDYINTFSVHHLFNFQDLLSL
jgi:hypothetical protein